ncbi:MAG TPA: phosphoribosylformylglycinamidine cyclo-ligase [Lachnospiraceae bacterium]|nr:phosphoribosylformylglycinamidine cyclo-ligase [Lachnospiraceae bacterium]
MEYKNAGVDVEAGYASVALMKQYVKKTFGPNVVTDLGGFGGLFSLAGNKMEDPILVSGTDGVGTKLKVAFLMDKHDTVGIDAVAMCVNDVICCGGSPLFFLDYIACGKNYPEKIASIVKGVADGCVQSHSALIGGETAEHPGLMPEDEYDIAGFSVGIVDRKDVIDGSKVKAGDAIIGLASSGVHSNGFSLVRKIFKLDEDGAKETLKKDFGVLDRPLGEVLLTPTRIYVKAVEALRQEVEVKAISHITGGGFYENIPRMLPDYTNAKIEKGSWKIPAIFPLMQKIGDISEHGMYNTYNMGIGMMLVVDKENVDKTIRLLKEAGEEAYQLGEIVSSDQKTPGVIV